MKTSLDCLSCFLRQALESARYATQDEALHREILREVLRAAAELNLDASPPEMAQHIHRVIRRSSGCRDPYRPAKKHFTAVALAMYPVLRHEVERAEDPLEAAVRMAIAGNIIDVGAGYALDESTVHEAVAHAWTAPLNGNLVELRDAAGEAKTILFLADNAGETVFDRLLIEQLGPEKVTVAVKGSPVLNDATREDAEEAGLVGWVEVIDNGSDAPGTILDDCSEPFRRRFEGADLVLAKGQGNYETLGEAPREVFFLLKAKCPIVTRDLCCELGDLILRRREPLAPSSLDGNDLSRPREARA